MCIHTIFICMVVSKSLAWSSLYYWFVSCLCHLVAVGCCFRCEFPFYIHLASLSLFNI